MSRYSDSGIMTPRSTVSHLFSHNLSQNSLETVFLDDYINDNKEKAKQTVTK